MKSVLVTVVIPVFNVEQYVKKCIDSVLSQTFDNYEVIIIDDGSTDKSGIICDEYINDKRVTIIHQDNQGLSAARNVGIDNAKGKYITFIDSDDYIDENYLRVLYSLITSNDADIAMCGWIRVKEDYNKVDSIIEKNSQEIVDKEELYKRMILYKGISMCAWSKMYKISLFNNNRYLVGKIYEDTFIINGLIEEANKIVVTNYNGYYHFKRKNSISQSNMTPAHMDLIEASTLFRDYMLQHYPNIKNIIINKYIKNNYTIYKKTIMDKSFITETNYIRKNILYYKKFILLRGTFKNKIQTLALMFGNKLYKLIYSSKKRTI